MWPSLKPSQRISLAGAINPQSSVAAVQTGWIDASTFENFLAVVSVGALGTAATVDAKLQQATSSAGAGAKDVAGTAITQLTKAAANDNSQVFINLNAAQLDTNNGFTFIRLLITPAVAASLVSGEVYGVDAKQEQPGGSNNAASLLQTVN